MILDPGSDSSLDAASTAHGRTASIAARTLSGPSRPASTTRPSATSAGRDAPDRPPPTEVENAGDGLAVPEQHGVRPEPAVVVAVVELDEVGAFVARLSHVDGDRKHRVGHREHRRPGAGCRRPG